MGARYLGDSYAYRPDFRGLDLFEHLVVVDCGDVDWTTASMLNSMKEPERWAKEIVPNTGCQRVAVRLAQD